MEDQEIEDYINLTQQEAITPPVFGGKRLTIGQQRKQAEQNYRNKLEQRNFGFAGPTTPVGNRIPTDSKYDEGMTIQDLEGGLNTYRDEKQGPLVAGASMLLHGLTAAGSSLAPVAMLTNPYGAAAFGLAAVGQALANAGDGIDNDNPISWLTDNIVTKSLNGAKEAIDKNTPVYSAAMDKPGGLKEHLASQNTLDQLVSGLGFMLGGMGGARIAAKALQSGEFYSVINKALGGDAISMSAEQLASVGKTAEDQAQAIAQAKKLTDGVTGITASAIGRFGESIMERQGTKDEMLANGATADEADKAANMNFLANMALSLPEYIQNVKMLGTFDGILNKIGIKGATGEFDKEASKLFLKGAEKVGKYDKVIHIAKALGENTLFEGGEEGIQYATNKGAQDSVNDGGGWLSYIKNAGKELGNSFTTEEGQMSWILGGLMGGPAAAYHAGKTYSTSKDLAQIHKNASELKNDLDKNYKVDENGLYTTYQKPDGTKEKVINQDYIDGIDNNGKLEAIKEYAKGKNDPELYKIAGNKQILNQALFNLSIENYDNFKKQLEHSTPSAEELKSIKALQENKKVSEVTLTGDDFENFKKQSQHAIKLADEFKKTYETAQNLPGFENLSKKALMKFGNVLATQHAVNTQLKEMKPEVATMLAEHGHLQESDKLDIFGNVTDPVEKKQLEQQYKQYKNLKEVNTELLNEYKKYLDNPGLLEDNVIKNQIKDVVHQAKEHQKEAEVNEKATTKLEDLKQSGGEYTLSTPDGPVTIKFDPETGQMINSETNAPIQEQHIKEELVNQIKEDENNGSIDKETPEDQEPTGVKLTDPVKPTINFSSVSGHEFSTNTDGTVDRSRKEIATSHRGNWVYKLNDLFKDFVTYLANPANTPFFRKGNNKAPQYTFEATLGRIDEAKLKEINEGRAYHSSLHGWELQQLSMNELENHAGFIPIQLDLMEDGKKVGTTHMHNPDYYFRTQEYFEDVKACTDESTGELNKIKLATLVSSKLDQYTKDRAKLIQDIKDNDGKVTLQTDTKSGGILNIDPKTQEGKIQVHDISTVSNWKVNGWKTNLFTTDGKEIIPNGIGVVTEVDEDGTGTIKFANGAETTITGYNVGSTVFQTVNAAGELQVINALSYNDLSSEQLQSITNLIFHRLSTGENEIEVNGKKYNIFGNKSKGYGIVDSLILIANRKDREKKIFFKSDGLTLVVAGKEFTHDSNPEETKQAIMMAIMAGNSKANFKVNHPGDSPFVLPNLVDGKWEGKETTYNDYMFKGDNPLIGTMVNQDLPFINSYFNIKTNDNGYITDLNKEEQVEPIYTQSGTETKKTTEVIPDQVYNDFIDNGKVSNEILESIANKVKNRIPLSERETAIFSDKTNEINTIISKDQVQSLEQKKADIEKRRQEELEKTITNENDLMVLAKVKEKNDPARTKREVARMASKTSEGNNLLEKHKAEDDVDNLSKPLNERVSAGLFLEGNNPTHNNSGMSDMQKSISKLITDIESGRTHLLEKEKSLYAETIKQLRKGNKQDNALANKLEAIQSVTSPLKGDSFGVYNGEKISGKTKQEVIEKINAKYDAELAALDGQIDGQSVQVDTKLQEDIKKDTEDSINDCNKGKKKLGNKKFKK